MVGVSPFINAFALGLFGYASAGSVVSTSTQASSDIVIHLEQDITIVSPGGIVAAAGADPVSVVHVQQNAYTVTGGGESAAQSSMATGFQKIVVTETQTVAGCTLNAEATGAVSAGGAFSGTASSGGASNGAVSSGSASTGIKGQAPFAVAASSSTIPEYAASTLLPAVHWDYPVDDIRNLAPSNSSNLYYSANGVSDPSIQHLFASLSTTTTYETVVLDHSAYVANTTCSDDGILVTFTSSEAFTFASTSWSEASSGFVLVTYTDGCHGSSDQQRTFWQVDSLQSLADSLSILAIVESELAIEHALYDVDLEWGTYYPTGNLTNGMNSSAGTGSFSSGSNTNSSSSGSGTINSGTSTGDGSSSSTSSSTSNSTSHGSACGEAPSANIDGLPAANCGDANFDKELDDAIGYLDFSNANVDGSSLSDFLPEASVSATDLASAEDGEVLSRRAVLLEKRWGWNPFKAIADAVVTVVKTVVTVATAPIQLAAAAVRNIPVVGDFIAKASELDPSISGAKDFNFGPDANADSPWGQAVQIYAKEKSSSSGTASGDVTIFCVGCGVKGHVALSGQAKFNILDGLHGLNAAIGANLEAGVNIGLVAHAQYSDTKTKALIRAPLPEVGVAVKGVFSAGVYLSVDAVSTVSVTAEGQALVGVVMTIPDFQAHLNLFDQSSADSSSISGLTPTFEKRFEATGQVAASVQLALPIAINCGFEIPALNLKRAIALIEQPSLYGNLTVAGSTPNVAPASETCNNGIEYFANLQNDVKLDFLGLKTFELNHYDSPPLLQGCKKFESSASSAVSSDVPSAAATSEASSATVTSDASSAAVTTDASSVAAATTDASIASLTATTDPSGDVPSAATSQDLSSTTPTNESSSVTSDVTANTTPTEQPTADTSTDSSNAPAATGDASPSSPDGKTATVTSVSRIRRSLMSRSDNSTLSPSNDGEDTNNESDDTFSDSDSSDQTNDAVSDDSTDSDGSEFTSNANDALELSADEQSADGVEFNTIVDVQRTFQLIPGDDGNLFAATYTAGSSSDTGLFGSYQNVVIGDDQERVLHYYPDEMAAYNASRIRLSSGDLIPKTADAITLSPIDSDGSDGENPTTYFAVTTKKDVYSLVVCNFANSANSKVFLVADQTGLDNLETNVHMKFTVTGAPVKDCSPIAMVSGGNGTATA